MRNYHVGERFGRLVVLDFHSMYVFPSGQKQPKVLVKCDCGTVKVVQLSNLGRTTNSCGCLESELTAQRNTKQFTTHGLSKSRTWGSWNSVADRMKGRCKYLDSNMQHDERWYSFENFLTDMGPAPSEKHSIDRIDNSKGYYKSNCRWATTIEQANNKRNTPFCILWGTKYTLKEACSILGIPKNVVHCYMNRKKVSAEEAIIFYLKRDKNGKETTHHP